MSSEIVSVSVPAPELKHASLKTRFRSSGKIPGIFRTGREKTVFNNHAGYSLYASSKSSVFSIVPSVPDVTFFLLQDGKNPPLPIRGGGTGTEAEKG